MGCSEKLECERLKVLNHACVLACQLANQSKMVLAVVKLTHQSYGDYYKGIDYKEAFDKGYRMKAKDDKLKIFRKFKPGDTMAVQNSNRDR